MTYTDKECFDLVKEDNAMNNEHGETERANWLSAELDRIRENCDRLEIDSERMKCALWAAWAELNSIRARDGAPSGVDHAYFNAIVEECNNILGEDARPWPAKRWLEQDGTLPWVKP